MAADLVNASLQDEMLAPSFPTADVAECLPVARTVGARVTVNALPKPVRLAHCGAGTGG